MSTLIEYLQQHATRRPHNEGGVDVVYFAVQPEPTATAEGLRAAMAQHRGEYVDVDPLDGAEHSYIELGGLIGDQGYALVLMALGSVLGLWKLNTPRSVLGDSLPQEHVERLAGTGLITIKA